MDNIYTKIYTKGNNILVLEGQGKEIVDQHYWPTGGSRLGTVVCGKKCISITRPAIDLFKQIVKKAEHTGDDLSCLDIYKADDGLVVVGWMGNIKQEIDINKLDEMGFWIGTGEGGPDLSLLDQLVIVDDDPTPFK